MHHHIIHAVHHVVQHPAFSGVRYMEEMSTARWAKVGLTLCFAYMLPTLIFALSGHYSKQIMLYNLIGGWTGVVWFVLFCSGIGLLIGRIITLPFEIIFWIFSQISYWYKIKFKIPRMQRRQRMQSEQNQQ